MPFGKVASGVLGALIGAAIASAWWSASTISSKMFVPAGVLTIVVGAAGIIFLVGCVMLED